ncbi:hypothetical protein B5X24_HaOG213913 [Helicoverpa armigera]|uniref:Protein ALP1-like n=1 Tax=Helicoverpa armigera TaxID=29058 RepID=A0A2W1B414_HELAM|nr:hypothetical protein B5X24_HaOG213913 [Helicoverpa armigera]
MDVEDVAAIYYIYSRYKKKQKKRDWVHPYLQTRDESKHFELFFEELKKYGDKFFGYTRMSLKSFEELLNILKTNITKQNTQFRNCIKPELKLTLVLRRGSCDRSTQPAPAPLSAEPRRHARPMSRRAAATRAGVVSTATSCS